MTDADQAATLVVHAVSGGSMRDKRPWWLGPLLFGGLLVGMATRRAVLGESPWLTATGAWMASLAGLLLIGVSLLVLVRQRLRE